MITNPPFQTVPRLVAYLKLQRFSSWTCILCWCLYSLCSMLLWRRVLCRWWCLNRASWAHNCLAWAEQTIMMHLC